MAEYTREYCEYSGLWVVLEVTTDRTAQEDPFRASFAKEADSISFCAMPKAIEKLKQCLEDADGGWVSTWAIGEALALLRGEAERSEAPHA